MKYVFLMFVFPLLLTCSDERMKIAKEDIPDFEDSAIHVNPRESRPYVFTNKESAFFYGETGKLREDGHNGFHVLEHKYIDDYFLEVDGEPLFRQEADSIKHYFDQLNRFYKNDIIERIILIDHLNCLLIKITAPTLHAYDFMPLISGVDDPASYEMQWSDGRNMLFIAAKTDIAKGEQLIYSPYLGIKFSKSTSFIDDANYAENQFIPAFRPGKFRCTAKQFYIAIVVGKEKDIVHSIASTVLRSPEYYINLKKVRLGKLLAKTLLETNQPYFDKAFKWAVVSMDQLVMNQQVNGQPVKGIFAGLPWFNNYWGRDTFISLPGALLVSGQFAEAKEVLRTYADFQQRDENDPNYGRIPNQTTTTNIIYNTADGTPWFVHALWQYYQYTGDRAFLEEMYPIVQRSIDGTIKFHTDGYQFLIHEDAETWMDAKTNEGAWSPRGNRAVEIQALWYEQLIIGSKICELAADVDKANQYSLIAKELREKFNHFYWDERRKRLYDHIDFNGQPDMKVRPNQIFAVTIPQQPLIKPELELMVIKEVVSKLTYRYGVASLWQHDQDFHPYHVNPLYYPKDEAYHNGTVWGWLAGPVITGMVKYGYQDLAYELLESESFQILDWGAVGTFSELLDAIPKRGEKMPKITGTVSQAWSLAEYVRNVYCDFLGIRPNVPERKIVFEPRLPNKLSQMKCKIPLDSDSLLMIVRRVGSEIEFELEYAKGETEWMIEFRYPENRTNKVLLEEKIRPGQRLTINVNFHRKPPILVNGAQTAYKVGEVYIPSNLFSYLTFAVPQLDKNLKCLKSPPYPMLSGLEIKKWNPNATLICDLKDPEFDDKGPDGRYQYPMNTNFKDGILDITRFQIYMDQHNYYFRLKFRNLVQPGWHPEYGFQLTYVAIALNQNNRGKTGTSNIGKNANYQLPPGFTYNRIIFIGGGLQVEDSKGNIICIFSPHDIRYPLGNVTKKMISFAIPKKYLGEYDDNCRFSVLVGAQDDRGGAGLGEFRNVHNTASEWHGGGGIKPTNNCNVYDFIVSVD